MANFSGKIVPVSEANLEKLKNGETVGGETLQSLANSVIFPATIKADQISDGQTKHLVQNFVVDTANNTVTMTINGYTITFAVTSITQN